MEQQASALRRVARLLHFAGAAGAVTQLLMGLPAFLTMVVVAPVAVIPWGPVAWLALVLWGVWGAAVVGLLLGPMFAFRVAARRPRLAAGLKSAGGLFCWALLLAGASPFKSHAPGPRDVAGGLILLGLPAFCLPMSVVIAAMADGPREVGRPRRMLLLSAAVLWPLLFGFVTFLGVQDRVAFVWEAYGGR